jgi:hypothetical protein
MNHANSAASGALGGMDLAQIYNPAVRAVLIVAEATPMSKKLVAATDAV